MVSCVTDGLSHKCYNCCHTSSSDISQKSLYAALYNLAYRLELSENHVRAHANNRRRGLKFYKLAKQSKCFRSFKKGAKPLCRAAQLLVIFKGINPYCDIHGFNFLWSCGDAGIEGGHRPAIMQNSLKKKK